MMMNLMMILVKKVFISSKPTFVCLLCPPPCGPFSIQESAAGGLSYKAKKERIPTAGFLRQRYPLYEALPVILVGILPPCAALRFFFVCFGQKIELTAQNPHFIRLSAFSSIITQSSFTMIQSILRSLTSRIMRSKPSLAKFVPVFPLSV